MRIHSRPWLKFLRRPAAAVLWLLGAAVSAVAAPVPIESVSATYQGGTDAELLETIDGVDVSRAGWSVAPRITEPQSAIFRCRGPVTGETVDVTLCFLSGVPNSFFGEFALLATSDRDPSFGSEWQPLTVVRFNATGPVLNLLDDGHITADGIASDAVFQVGVLLPERPVTAFRVDVFPREQRLRKTAAVAPSKSGDFVLTEFRVDAATPRTTNIALGRPVRASHPLWGAFTPGMLTDGLPGTFAHALQPDLGPEFFFEIDLGSVRSLDHIALRNRGDRSVPERLSRVQLELYDAAPDEAAKPSWRGRIRADGSHSRSGDVDVVRASDGTGAFRGQYLRISSDSPIAFSPQLAEVEVYETLGLAIESVRLDEQFVRPAAPLQIPSGTKLFTVSMRLTRGGMPDDLLCRWRVRGYHSDWQIASGLTVDMPCPPAGSYTFEAQVRHTDREWDSSVAGMPMLVAAHFWQSRGFRLAVLGVLVAGLVMVERALTRRRVARRMMALEAKAALDEERARIARDMHDEVGARLSQLAILQEVFAQEHPLPASARENLSQLTDSARQAVASLDEVVWAVNPRNDTLPALAEYLAQCATGYLGPLEIRCRIDAPLEWPAVEIRAQVRHNVVLAFREALQNILKHAGATEVTLTLRYERPQFTCRIADNGRGLPADPGGPGKDGLVNMRARLAAAGGICDVRTRPEGGTEVEMRVPLQHDHSG